MATPDPLSSPDRLRRKLKRPGLDEQTAQYLVDDASDAFRGATGQHITLVVGDVVTLDANGSWSLLLPEVPVRAVTSVVVDGQALTADDYTWSESGVLRRRGRWPAKFRSVVVTYDHGYDEVPGDVQDAVAEAAALEFTRHPGVTNVQLGATSYGFEKAGATQKWVDTVARYRVRR